MLEGAELYVVVQVKSTQERLKYPCVGCNSYCLTDFGNKFNHRKLDKYGNCACNREF